VSGPIASNNGSNKSARLACLRFPNYAKPTVGCAPAKRHFAKALADFQRTSPDWHPHAMQTELSQFLRDVIEADGVVTSREQRALAAVEAALRSENALVSRTTVRRARTLAIGVRQAAEQDVASAGTAITEVVKAAGAGLNRAAVGMRAATNETIKRSAVVADVMKRHPPDD
jgi:hypothetical protein